MDVYVLRLELFDKKWCLSQIRGIFTTWEKAFDSMNAHLNSLPEDLIIVPGHAFWAKKSASIMGVYEILKYKTDEMQRELVMTV
jgi:hypothetical protein